jgi:hypothetical protein
MKPIKLNPQHVPHQFRMLIPLAEIWGINDDGYRATKIQEATEAEIQHLKQQVLPFVDQMYLEWLGETSHLENEAGEAYIAFTALILAAEES